MHTFERRCISPQKHRSSSEAWRWEHQDVGLFSSLHWNAWQNWRKDGNIYRDNKNCCHLSGWWRWNGRLKPRSWFHRRKIKHGPANQLTRKNQVITNKGFCICIKYISVTMFNVFPVSFMVWLDGLFLTSGGNFMSHWRCVQYLFYPQSVSECVLHRFHFLQV